MSDFKSRFDAQIAVANSAAANNTTALQAHAIGMHPAHLRRMLENISKLLGVVDRKGHKHPEFLASTPTIVPERAIELVASIKPNFDAGIESFIQNVLPALVDVEDKLTKAVGVSALRTADIKNSQVRAINQILDRAQIQGNEAANIAKTIREENQQIEAEKKRLNEVLEAVSADRKKIEEIARQAEKLARGNSSQNALENLVRTARSKSDEINEVLASVKTSQEAAADAAKVAIDSSEKSKASLDGLNASDKKALGILNNVTQAGLAGAYKTERDNLKKQQDRFSQIFYGIIVLVIVYAAIFILPIVSKILAVNGATDLAVKENALLLLVRFLIVTPAIWALIFTNKRYVTLEALQMDYAAKASTALAYSGYRDEMGDDIDLSKRLKDGLLMRFLEHPSRLLGSRVDDHKDFGFSSDDKQQSSKKSEQTSANDDSEGGD